MKVKSAGNNGFSTLELMIAFAIMAIVLSGAFAANVSAQFWSITSQTSGEGLYKAKSAIEDLRALAKDDFYQTTSTAAIKSIDPSDPRDASCTAGGLCYYVEKNITDLSVCSKYAEAKVSWRVANFSTTSTSLFTNLTNSNEAIALGGDCTLNQPGGNFSQTPQIYSSLNFSPGKILTSLDVFHGYIYATASTSPYLTVWKVPTSFGAQPVLVGSSDGAGVRLNDIDVAEDLSTGRTYAYVAQNATTSQLGVFDVTDVSNPALVATRRLMGTNKPIGSYPEGNKIFYYGNRVYETTRETSGDEFHIFNVTIPPQPTEISASAELNRTVNQMIVHEQKVSGTVHRYAYFASDSDLKELGLFDVTGDALTEVASVDLSGTQDGLSLALAGNTLYLGRSTTSVGGELYSFDVSNPSAGSIPQTGAGEVSADVSSISVSGSYVFLGTAKAGQEFQVWSSGGSTWNQSALNAGRLSYAAFPNMSPDGIEIEGNLIFGISQQKTGDGIRIFYAQ